MPDHEAMRAAMLRALDVTKSDFLDHCNSCKTPFSYSFGEIVDVIAVDKKYKIWYCSQCADEPVYC